MTISAVLLHYYPERTENVKRIVGDLLKGDVKPDKIIVFNNNKDVFLELDSRVFVINSNHNFRWMTKYAMGLLGGTDYCLIMDDDLTVMPETLKYLSEQSKIYPRSIIGFYGQNLGKDSDKPYSSGEDIKDVTKPTKVDIVKGRIQFCKRSVLANVFVLETNLDLVVSGAVSEDVSLSLANKVVGKNENFVLPPKITELSEKGVGCQYTPNHYSRRNETCRRILDMKEKI